MPTSTVHLRDLLHAANLRHGTHGFTSLPKEGVLRTFPALKNPTDSVGFEPEASTLNPRPLKPLPYMGEFVLKISWLFSVQFINENRYWHAK
jgi:hypothetical protein